MSIIKLNYDKLFTGIKLTIKALFFNNYMYHF